MPDEHVHEAGEQLYDDWRTVVGPYSSFNRIPEWNELDPDIQSRWNLLAKVHAMFKPKVHYTTMHLPESGTLARDYWPHIVGPDHESHTVMVKWTFGDVRPTTCSCGSQFLWKEE